MQSQAPHAHSAPPPPSQANPGSNVVLGDARRREALRILADYYRDVELGRAPLD